MMGNGLPELPKAWVWAKLGEVCLEPQYGWTTSAAIKGKLRLLRTTDITNGSINWDSVPFCKEEPPEKGKYILKDGDIVISRAGSVGYSSLIKNPKESVFASYLIRFRPLVDEVYFSYFLKSPSYWASISEKSLGIAIPNVNASKLRQILVPISPLPEQHRIVAKIEELFTKLDAGIEALKKIKAQLKRYRQAVLKHAFEGKLTQEWRETNKGKIEPASALLERIKEQRQKETKGKVKELPPVDTSELPELPEGWVWSRLGEVSDAIGGYAFKSSDFKERGNYQVIKIGNVKMGFFRLDERPSFLDDVALQIIEKYALHYGDLVITLTGTRKKRDYGFVAMVKSEGNLLLNQRLAAVRFFKPLYPGYFQYALRSDHFQNNFFKHETGNVGQGNVGMNAIVTETISIPPLLEQQNIVEEIENRLSIADNMEKVAEQSLQQSDRLRQSILKRAFEGNLVPHDPTDEPAEKLLERIREERVKWESSNKKEKKHRSKNPKQMELI